MSLLTQHWPVFVYFGAPTAFLWLVFWWLSSADEHAAKVAQRRL